MSAGKYVSPEYSQTRGAAMDYTLGVGKGVNDSIP